MKEIEIELKFAADEYNNGIRNTDNADDSSPSDNSSGEDMSDNENKPTGSERYQPHPPSAPIPDNARRHRRHHLQVSKQSQEPTPPLQSSMSIDSSTLRSRNRHAQQQSESEADSPQADAYNATPTRRRSGIFQSLKLKKNKVPLPRPTSARKEGQDDERQQEKTRKSTSGTLKPARVGASPLTCRTPESSGGLSVFQSLLNLFSAGNLPSGKSEKSSANTPGYPPSTGSARKMSVMSRSSSMDNPYVSETNGSSQRKTGHCLWNLDFTPYNSPLIRIK